MELSSELSIISILALGFFFGLKHAIEADHLAAVSTIVSEKGNVFTAAYVGGLWGLGHTVSLFIVGVLVIVLKLQISKYSESMLEAAVGVMLILLGLNALRKIFWDATPDHADGHTHKFEEKSGRFSPRSILVGMIHGLAGSAALMLLILPTIPSTAVALLYIIVFGVGSIVGMMLMSVVMSLPLYFTANRFDFLNKAIRGCAGVFSFVLGFLIVFENLKPV